MDRNPEFYDDYEDGFYTTSETTNLNAALTKHQKSQLISTTSEAFINEWNFTVKNFTDDQQYNNNSYNETDMNFKESQNNYWSLLALILVFGTAAGNILVCLAIAWERRLQNVTNYFLMSLAMTDLMVAILVMPLGILTLYAGYFPLHSEHCLVWICLDVLFCTASIMHLCTISVDRYLSLRYPMRFGRNKTRRRVIVKIFFVWLLSIAMSLPLSLMYSKDHSSVLVNGTCQIPDPVYKLVGSIVCFYIPLGVMLLTYCLTVRLLARQKQNIGGINNNINNNQQATSSGWSSGWMGQTPGLERRCTWKRFLKTSHQSTPSHGHSATSTDTELSNLDTHELWLPDTSVPEPTPSTMTALHQFGAEMLKLSRGLESVSSSVSDASSIPQQNTALIPPAITSLQLSPKGHKSSLNFKTEFTKQNQNGSEKKQMKQQEIEKLDLDEILQIECEVSPSSSSASPFLTKNLISHKKRRRASTSTPGNKYIEQPTTPPPRRKRFNSLPKNALQHHVHHHHYHHHHHLQNDEDILFVSSSPLSSSSNSKCALKKLCENSASKDDTKICNDKNCQNTDDNNIQLPPPCTCPYFGDRRINENATNTSGQSSIISIHQGNKDHQMLRDETDSTKNLLLPKTQSNSNDSPDHLPVPSTTIPVRKLSYSKTASVVTWDSARIQRRGSSFGGCRTSLLLTPNKVTVQSGSLLRRSATLRNHNNQNYINGTTNESTGQTSTATTTGLKSSKLSSSPCLLQRSTTVRSHHSRNSSVISRNSARHGRIIRLEQKATKVLGVVFFTFVILWAPFFVLTLLPTFCDDCEQKISHWVFDVVTWLGYASSMVNPIFYTIFNKVFRQAFKKVLLCQYADGAANHWRPNR